MFMKRTDISSLLKKCCDGSNPVDGFGYSPDIDLSRKGKRPKMRKKNENPALTYNSHLNIMWKHKLFLLAE